MEVLIGVTCMWASVGNGIGKIYEGVVICVGERGYIYMVSRSEKGKEKVREKLVWNGWWVI